MVSLDSLFRKILVEWPAAILDAGVLLYMLLLACAALACFVSVALVLLAYVLGFPQP